MTAEIAHHPSGPLVMALSLAGVAGFIDAHLFLHVTNVFVANMSGNMVRAGILTGSGDWALAAESLAALFAFVAGVIVAIAHHDRQLQQNNRVRPDDLLVVEALLTLALPIILIVGGVGFSNEPRAINYVVIGIGAFAMGIQASTLRRVGNIAVATTYGTGTVVRIGEKVALARRAERTSDDRRSATIIVLVGVLACYVGGAAVASALGSSPLLLLVPSAVLLTFAASVRWSAGFRTAFVQSRMRRSDRRTTDY